VVATGVTIDLTSHSDSAGSRPLGA